MKNIRKKLAVLILAGVMATGFSGCSGDDSNDTETTTPVVAEKNDEESKADEQQPVNNDNGGDESAPPAQNNNPAETFKDYSNKSVENGKSASWLWIDTGMEDLLGDSDIFEITFKIKDGVADGNYNVVINELQICNKATEIVDAKVIDGVVTVGSATAPEATTADGAAVSLVNTKGNAGDTITMKVNFSKNPGFCAVQMGINYDASVLEITDVVNTGVINELGSVTLNLGQ